MNIFSFLSKASHLLQRLVSRRMGKFRQSNFQETQLEFPWRWRN